MILTPQKRQTASELLTAELLAALLTENKALRDLNEAYRAALGGITAAVLRQRKAQAALVERRG